VDFQLLASVLINGALSRSVAAPPVRLIFEFENNYSIPGTGRQRHLKKVQKAFRNGFREGSTIKPQKKSTN
jgi:hypothetical protein